MPDYSATCIGQKFFIPIGKISLADEAIKNSGKHQSNTLEEALAKIHWDMVKDDRGIVELQQTTHEMSDEVAVLTVIAPFVEHGSFFVFHGEDGITFRYFFNDGKMSVERTVLVVFEDKAEELISALNLLEHVLGYCDRKMGLKEIKYWEADGDGHTALSKLRDLKHKLEDSFDQGPWY